MNDYRKKVFTRIKHGHWTFKDKDDAPYYDCSECGAVVLFGNQYNYCPYCGAKMEDNNE